MMSADITPAKGAFHSREQSAAPPTELAAGRVPANSRTVETIELVALCALALSVALPLRGLFLKPHGDFYGIWETGAALIHGELPPSFKRAPLYPLLVASLGAAFEALGYDEVPAQRAAEWINALLLPVNVALVFLLGRRWLGQCARWPAWWFALLPVGMYCTTYTLVEPFLIATVLLTIVAAQRESRWAWVFAALAALTRYDAAGAIPGLLIADLVARRTWRGALARAALASMPLAVWLILTAITWQARGADHYLAELAERPQFSLWPALAATPHVVLDIEDLRIPYLWQVLGLDPRTVLRYGLHVTLTILACSGLVVGLREHRRAVIPAMAIYVGYSLVHAVFPFQFDRFGYPLAPLYLLAAGLGWRGLATRYAAGLPGGRVVRVVVLLLCAAFAALLVGELRGFEFLTSTRYAWVIPLPGLVLVSTAILWGLAPAPLDRYGRRVLLLLGLAVLALTHLRAAARLVSGGAEMDSLVQAARWVRDHMSAGQRVASATPGLLRLYAGRKPAGRFLGFDELAGQTWPELVAECRRRQIGYLIWYDGIFGELGDYYVRKCRLDRFAGLADPERLSDITVANYFPHGPRLWILRVLSAAERGATGPGQPVTQPDQPPATRARSTPTERP